MHEKRSEKDSNPRHPPLTRQLSYQFRLRTTTHIGTVRTRKGADHLKPYSHLYPNKHQEVVDMMQNQHQKDMATSDVTAPAEASEAPKPQGTRFKVVSPKDKTSPQQVHEDDLSPCVGFNRRT